MSEEVSVLRLYVMRCMYLLNFVLVGSSVWVQFIHRQKPWDLITGGGRPLKRPDAGIPDRNRIGHDRDSLAVCTCALHQEAGRSVEGSSRRCELSVTD